MHKQEIISPPIVQDIGKMKSAPEVLAMNHNAANDNLTEGKNYNPVLWSLTFLSALMKTTKWLLHKMNKFPNQATSNIYIS